MDVVVENLTKSFGYQKAVDSVSFEVKKGEILGFLGPNGAGKTTTLKIMSCYFRIMETSVSVNIPSIKTPIKSNKSSVIYPSTIHSTKR